MCTPVLPLVDVVRCNWFLADKPVDTSFASITDVFDFYSRDFAADARHAFDDKRDRIFTQPHRKSGRWRIKSGGLECADTVEKHDKIRGEISR